jgi:hypothetical protein
MSVLGAINYNPAVAVSKSTAAALAMTALDTTNLRITFGAPASGRVFVQMIGTIHGAATYPQILFGVMSGATVMGAVSPQGVVNGTALATTFQNVAAFFPVTGLTPANSYSFDAAYGVETLVASSAIKYGGPNNATANDAFGGFVFVIYDL